MGKRILIRVPFEFFEDYPLTVEDRWRFLSCAYVPAVKIRDEMLPRSCVMASLISLGLDEDLAELSIKRWAAVGLILLSKESVHVQHVADRHKALFNKKRKAREAIRPFEVPPQLKALPQLASNRDLCVRYKEIVKSWEQRFPNVNIFREMVKANGWLTDNPKQKRPNKVRFLANWLKKAQGRVERSQAYGASTGPKGWE